MAIDKFSSCYEIEKNRFISEWFEFLKFESISTDPEYDGACRACADWLVGHLASIGFRSELWPTSRKPVVYAHRPGKSGKPHILFYGHYDVQPVDPIELWTSPPFKPEIRGERVYARGACDDKGQVFYFVKAVEELIKANQLECSLSFLIEGEEESGSLGLSQALPGWALKLKSDILMICDTGTPVAGVGAITMGLRGLCDVSVRLRGPSKDLHSGVHGGLVVNPAQAVSRLAASLHDDSGKIAIKGYYDQVAPLDPDDMAAAEAFPMTEAVYEQLVGAKPWGGETGLGMAVRRGLRPTLEINGIHSGYGGPGVKTVIPSEAVLKITSRLVGGQDPDRCLALIVDHLNTHCPKGVTLEIEERRASGGAFQLSTKSPVVAKARETLQTVTGKPALLVWEGASIPIVPELARLSGGVPLLVGFGLEEDNLHSPNESFALEQFRQGFLFVSEFLARQ